MDLLNGIKKAEGGHAADHHVVIHPSA